MYWWRPPACVMFVSLRERHSICRRLFEFLESDMMLTAAGFVKHFYYPHFNIELSNFAYQWAHPITHYLFSFLTGFSLKVIETWSAIHEQNRLRYLVYIEAGLGDPIVRHCSPEKKTNGFL
jgi:hypothetical protein